MCRRDVVVACVHTIYPPSLVVIAFIFSELRRGGGGGGAAVEDQKMPGLNRVKDH